MGQNETKTKISRKNFALARAVFRLGVLPACALLLAGCGIARRQIGSPPGQTPRIVVIAGAPGENWSAARNGAGDAGKALGAGIEWHVPAVKAPVAQQEKWIEDAINSNADGIALAPVDATSLVSSVNDAGRAFVPALVFDTPAYTKEKLTFIKSDDRAAGVLAARAAAKILGGKGRVWVLPTPVDSSGAQSAKSFAATVRKESPAIQIAAFASGALPGAGVLYAPNEATSRAALKMALPATRLIASGSSTDLIQGLESGKVSALVVPDRYEMAYQSVRVILEYRAHRPPQTEIEIAPLLVTKDTLQIPKIRRFLGLESNGA